MSGKIKKFSKKLISNNTQVLIFQDIEIKNIEIEEIESYIFKNITNNKTFIFKFNIF